MPVQACYLLAIAAGASSLTDLVACWFRACKKNTDSYPPPADNKPVPVDLDSNKVSGGESASSNGKANANSTTLQILIAACSY